MNFARAQANANRAVAARMGVRVTYLADQARREITATPGDVTTQPTETERGIEIRSTCPWSVRTSEISALLGGQAPARGHILLLADPVAGETAWRIEHAQPDLADGWVLYTVQSDDAELGARGAKQVR